MSNKGLKIDSKEMLICPICSHKNRLSIWEELSQRACVNREMKRAYKSLTDYRVYLPNSENYYQCPDCKRWVCGKHIQIDTDNEQLRKLGTVPYFKSL